MVIIVFAALSVIWGMPYLFIKVAVAEVPPIGVAWCDLALGAGALLPIAWRRGALQSIVRHKSAICALALAQLALPSFLIALGERWISSSLAGTLIAAVPLAVLALGPLFGSREPLRARRLAGFAAGFSGVVVLLGSDTVGQSVDWIGVACIAGATLAYAVAPLIVERYLAGVDGLGAVAASLGVATVVLLPGAAWSAPANLPSTRVLSALLVLGVVCTALGLLLYFFLIRRVGAARASVVTYINPAVAALLGVAVLNEQFGLAAALGLLLIVAGSWLATRHA